MEPLKTIQWLLKWQSISPPEQSASLKQRIAYIAFSITVATLILYYAASCLILFIQFVRIDLKEALFALMAFSGCAALLYTVINAFRARFKINELFEKLSLIYSESKKLRN